MFYDVMVYVYCWIFEQQVKLADCEMYCWSLSFTIKFTVQLVKHHPAFVAIVGILNINFPSVAGTGMYLSFSILCIWTYYDCFFVILLIRKVAKYCKLLCVRIYSLNFSLLLSVWCMPCMVYDVWYVLAQVEKKCWSRSGISTSEEVPFWWDRCIFVGRRSCIVSCYQWWVCQVFLLSVIN